MQTVFSSSESFLPFGGLVRPAGILAAFGPSWSNTGDWGFDADTGEVAGNYTGGFYYTNVPLVAGQQYVMRLYVREYTAGGVIMLFNNAPTSLSASAPGVYEVTFTATGNDVVNLKGYGFTGILGWAQISPV
jgi:hypothetical protein